VSETISAYERDSGTDIPLHPRIPRAIDTQLDNLKYNLFSEEWLAKPDELEYTKEPFPSNGDRIAAGEVAKRQDTESFTK
jgi:hypothetical protein